MKKLVFCFVLFCLAGFRSMAAGSGSAYKADDQQVDALFAHSEDISMAGAALAAGNSAAPFSVTGIKESSFSKGGFLLRCFFCGSFALHRYYAGGKGAALFFEYFCTFGFISFVDFWWVVFVDGAAEKFKGSSKWVVWG